MTPYQLPKKVLADTFKYFRDCGRGRHECQVLWVSPWNRPESITGLVHPQHRANGDGFVLNDAWLNQFWVELARNGDGVRIQVHTHPQEAFHSATDDAFPIIHSPGFLSLVIPNFAQGPVGFDGAYLTEIQPNGRWQQVAIAERIKLV